METRPIPGQHGYFAGSDGSIWSTKSGVFRKLSLFARGRIGHLGVNLTQGGKYRLFSVHRLVALAFIGEPPSHKHLVMHLDDQPTHNWPDNLRYGLPADNSAQMVARGRQSRGDNHPSAKLTREAATHIRECFARGLSQRAVAQQFGISQATAWAIKHNLTWRHA